VGRVIWVFNFGWICGVWVAGGFSDVVVESEVNFPGENECEIKSCS
jgi:hypothetical protein